MIDKNIRNFIYVQWTTNDNHCFDVGISRQTNDDMDPDEYVAEADEWDQQPYGEGVKQQVQDKSWWANSTNSYKGPTKLVISRV